MDDSADIPRLRKGTPNSSLGASLRRNSYKALQPDVTLSFAAPEDAAKIRSTVTGALRLDGKTGFWCFEKGVETTFVLPWDLNPRVKPERFSDKMRTDIRNQLMDAGALANLEGCGALNWNSAVSWDVKSSSASGVSPGAVGDWTPLSGATFIELETLYHTDENECTLSSVNGAVSFADSIFRGPFGTAQQLRRLECSPLMPLKVDAGDGRSLFHAASMGFWGVHDRSNVLRDAVLHSLQDVKASFIVFKRWAEGRMLVAQQNGTPISRAQMFEVWEAAKSTELQLYVFALANIVQRPIIVYAQSTCSVGGIYLPLLWKAPMDRFPCDMNPALKNPLVLGFDATDNLFVPLATFKGIKGPSLILLPLVHSNGEQLPVHYLSTEEANIDRRDALLQHLLNIYVHRSSDPSVANNLASGSVFPSHLRNQSCPAIATAVLDTPEMPEIMDSLIKRFETQFL